MSKVRCAGCKKFIDKAGAISNGMQNFCDKDHLILYRNKLRQKVKKGGFPPGLKATVMDLDGGRCRFCGTDREHLIVHHITYRSAGGPHTEANLITLCRPHHDEVHSNKKHYAPLCEHVVGLRMEKGDKTTTISQLERET